MPVTGRFQVALLAGIATVALSAALLAGLGAGARAEDKDPQKEEQKAEQKPAAKQTPPEVIKRMKYYNEALGVECEYCHVPNKYEIETPRKKTARWMQQRLVDGLVTKEATRSIDCRTCHDGRARFLPSSQ